MGTWSGDDASMTGVGPLGDAATNWVACARAGHFERAWAISADTLKRRLELPQATLPRHLQTVWNGTPLHGRRVLIRCYHGLGDTIQFIRYASLVREIAGEVTVWAQPQLMPLLPHAAGIDRLMPLHDGVPAVDYDVDVEVMELPFVFRSTLSSLPATVPYLRIGANSPQNRGIPRVGIVWRGGLWDPRRAIAFPLLARLFELPGISWQGLQYDAAHDEQHDNLVVTSGATILDTARAMRGLDLVISIDSWPAHLAGALAVPVWTLLRHDADWRWMEGRADSPWYPTMRLFRQPVEGDWEAVIAEIGRRLSVAIDDRSFDGDVSRVGAARIARRSSSGA
jgi:hypothetical protein